MSKGRSRKGNRNRQRGNPQFHKDDRLLPFRPSPRHIPSRVKKSIYQESRFLQTVNDDRRLWKPDLQRRFLLYGKKNTPARVRLRNRTVKGKRFKSAPRLGFEAATRLRVCQRRHERRETLFRRGKVGRGVRIRTKKRLNPFSKIRC